MSNLFVASHNDIAEAGFPDVLCPVIFLEGCNFKCPYCLNAQLVKRENTRKIPLDFVIDKYKKDDEILISGGEPLCNKKIREFVAELRESGFSVRISTNGSFPEILEDMVVNKMVSFVAMDVKMGFDDREKWKAVSNQKETYENVLRSIEILNKGNVDCEFRTTLFPPLVGEKDIASISGRIGKGSNWFLQQFRLKKNLLGGNFFGKVMPYGTEKLKKIVGIARQNVKNTRIRDV